MSLSGWHLTAGIMNCVTGWRLVSYKTQRRICSLAGGEDFLNACHCYHLRQNRTEQIMHSQKQRKQYCIHYRRAALPADLDAR
jgi:hypothetical protein